MATKLNSVFTATQNGKALTLNVSNVYQNGADTLTQTMQQEVVDFNKSKIDFIYLTDENFVSEITNEPIVFIGGFIIHEDGVKKFDFRFDTQIVNGEFITRDEANFDFKMSSHELNHINLDTATDVMSAFLDNQYNS